MSLISSAPRFCALQGFRRMDAVLCMDVAGRKEGVMDAVLCMDVAGRKEGVMDAVLCMNEVKEGWEEG